MVMTQEYLLQALIEALKMELEGRRFYLEAAQRTKSASVRRTLEYLADCETLHIEKFNALYQNLQKDPAWTQSMASGEPPPLKPEIFALPGDQDEPAAGYEDDLEAMRTMLRLEQSGADYYNHLAQKVSNPLARRFFISLANEEQGHYNLILDLINFLEINCGGNKAISAPEENPEDLS